MSCLPTIEKWGPNTLNTSSRMRDSFRNTWQRLLVNGVFDRSEASVTIERLVAVSAESRDLDAERPTLRSCSSTRKSPP